MTLPPVSKGPSQGRSALIFGALHAALITSGILMFLGFDVLEKDRSVKTASGWSGVLVALPLMGIGMGILGLFYGISALIALRRKPFSSHKIKAILGLVLSTLPTVSLGISMTLSSEMMGYPIALLLLIIRLFLA